MAEDGKFQSTETGGTILHVSIFKILPDFVGKSRFVDRKTISNFLSNMPKNVGYHKVVSIPWYILLSNCVWFC